MPIQSACTRVASKVRRAPGAIKRRLRYGLHPKALMWNHLLKRNPGTPIITSLGEDLKVRIYPGDIIGKFIYIDGVFEPVCWGFVKRFLRPGMVVFDLGANLGQYTLLAARCVGKSGRVHSFEPSRRMFAELEFNVQLNGLSDICLLTPLAVSDACGAANLSRYEPGAEVYGSLGRHTRTEAAVIGYECVKTVTLDDYVERMRVERVDFLKMDIEGAELPALRGAEKLLSASDAPTILLEMADVNTEGFGYQASEIWDFLEERGYRLFVLDSDGRPPKETVRPKDFLATMNVVASKAAEPCP